MLESDDDRNHLPEEMRRICHWIVWVNDQHLLDQRLKEVLDLQRVKVVVALAFVLTDGASGGRAARG